MSKYIDADKLLEVITERLKPLDSEANTNYFAHKDAIYKLFKYFIKEAPAADVVEVTRCKDCEWFNACVNGNVFKIWDTDDFCSYAVRKDS